MVSIGKKPCKMPNNACANDSTFNSSNNLRNKRRRKKKEQQQQ